MEFIGLYKCVQNDNFNAFLKAIGTSYISRLFMKHTKPTVAVFRMQDFWSITVKSLFVSRAREFRLGHEVTEFLPGRVIKRISKMDNELLIIRSIIDNRLQLTTTYEFQPRDLIITVKEEKTGIEAKRFFKRLPTKI